MAAAVDVGTLVVRTPEMQGGRPRIAGTGVTARRIAGWYQLGLSLEEIAPRVGHVSLAQVDAALAYYHANRGEIDADIAAEEDEAERLEQDHLPFPEGRMTIRLYVGEDAMAIDRCGEVRRCSDKID